MLRAVLLVLALIVPALPALAQDRTQTLADIRQELQILFADIQRLRSELNTTGPAMGVPVGQGTLERVDALESEVRRLSGLTEDLQLRLSRIAEDGANRIADLEFRLCELEDDCSLSDLQQGTTLGGGEGDVAATIPETGGGATGPSQAVGEQGDFDRARAALQSGDFDTAAQGFSTFVSTYPGSVLTTDAQFFLAEAEAGRGNWQPAARAYLNTFSANPTGPRAAEALLNVGTSLNQLGQGDAACQTLVEVSTRFPGTAQAVEAQTARASFGCF